MSRPLLFRNSQKFHGFKSARKLRKNQYDSTNFDRVLWNSIWPYLIWGPSIFTTYVHFRFSPIQMTHLQFVVSTDFQNRSFYFQDTWPDCCFLIGWNSPMIGSSSLRRELHLISFLLNSLIIILNSFDESII